MNYLQAITLLLTFFWQTHSQNYVNNYTFDRSLLGCIFHLHYLNDECTLYNFSYCEWNKCDKWATINNFSYCTQSKSYTNTQWSFCISQCCDSSMTCFSSPNQCPISRLDPVILTIQILLTIMVVGIPFILIIKSIKRHGGCVPCIRNCYQRICNKPQQLNIPQQQIINFEMQRQAHMPNFDINPRPDSNIGAGADSDIEASLPH